jgi:hypothetical protein
LNFFNPHHPDRLCPASPATRLFGLLRQPALKISIFYNEKPHRTVSLFWFAKEVVSLKQRKKPIHRDGFNTFSFQSQMKYKSSQKQKARIKNIRWCERHARTHTANILYK